MWPPKLRKLQSEHESEHSAYAEHVFWTEYSPKITVWSWIWTIQENNWLAHFFRSHIFSTLHLFTKILEDCVEEYYHWFWTENGMQTKFVMQAFQFRLGEISLSQGDNESNGWVGVVLFVATRHKHISSINSL